MRVENRVKVEGPKSVARSSRVGQKSKANWQRGWKSRVWGESQVEVGVEGHGSVARGPWVGLEFGVS
jgi:hypothetical protein